MPPPLTRGSRYGPGHHCMLSFRRHYSVAPASSHHCMLSRPQTLSALQLLVYTSSLHVVSSTDTIGAPAPGLLVKLADVPLQGYFLKEGKGEVSTWFGEKVRVVSHEVRDCVMGKPMVWEQIQRNRGNLKKSILCSCKALGCRLRRIISQFTPLRLL